ncbi:MAG: prepilin peptidase [Deltaproteobacteria bacterium]|nr:prepilin peptidase [Deltaproteobacteria bacterium]
MMPSENFLLIEAALFGLVIGSFLNVCIHRLPLQKSLGGRSFCPACAHKIPGYDNIPVLSFLVLRGRCRFCREPISLQYPLVEIIAGGLSVLTLLHVSYELDRYFIWYLLFVAPLIVLSFIDLHHRILPDVITLPGIAGGMGAILYLKFPFWKEGLVYSATGIVVGGGTLFLLATLYTLIRKREGMGGGDIKLCGMLGAFLGWKGMVFIFLISSVLAILYAVVSLIVPRTKNRSDEAGPMIIPYGPFLAMAALIFYFYGLEITSFYFSLIGIPSNPVFTPQTPY